MSTNGHQQTTEQHENIRVTMFYKMEPPGHNVVGETTTDTAKADPALLPPPSVAAWERAGSRLQCAVSAIQLHALFQRRFV